MNATTLQSSSTLNSNQSTMSCMGNPQAIIRKCVHPSMPHSNFYSLGNKAKIPNCNLRKKCCWFSQNFNSAEFLCKGWQMLYVCKWSFKFFMFNLLPQNLKTFFEIYRSATGPLVNYVQNLFTYSQMKQILSGCGNQNLSWFLSKRCGYGNNF